MKLAIVYYSESGNTKQAAEYVAEGMKKAGAEVGLFELDKIDEAFVAEAKAVVFGAPTFYADTCAVRDARLSGQYLLADEEVL